VSAIRVGIIGVGWGAIVQTPAFRMLPEYDVVAICARRPESVARAGESLGIPDTSTDWEAFVRRDDLDLISVCTPVGLHAAQTIAAVEAGKHVLVEKPQALDAVDARRMLDAAQRAGVAHAVCFEGRYDTNRLPVTELVAAGVLGLMVVLPIGGADMPVVISLLNAMTGLSAAAAGLALNNTAMIVAGMIVGASGSILTDLMAKAMNRSIPAIVAGGFGGGGAVEGASGAGEHAGTVRSIGAADAAIQLAYASRVVVVPGYGMAVAQAQHAVRELTKELEDRGVEVSYAIHPVAGRMPGHMNVLLAEADVPYDQLREMDDANPEFQRTDVSLVIGANDVTNPAAKNTPSSPIYGMPILEVSNSHSVIVIKRSMNPGFAGIENELYYEPETSMLFGDAKSAVSEITAALADI